MVGCMALNSLIYAYKILYFSVWIFSNAKASGPAAFSACVSKSSALVADFSGILLNRCTLTSRYSRHFTGSATHSRIKA